MEPEIARRCLDCGASVRGNAFFCPQCGRALKAVEGAAGVGSAAEASEMHARRKTEAGLNASTVDVPESAPAATPSDLAATQASFTLDALEENHQRAEVAPSPTVMEDDGATSKRQRVTTAARDMVEEKLSPRVEKLRQASNVMLEEASYDSSLRFVLVAVAVLVLSLFLLLLNYLLG
jgi:hypothetical protein